MHIPADALEFNDQFKTEEDCLSFLEKLRWPNGFICPNCSHDFGYKLKGRPLYQCGVCRQQVSVTAGTIFHKTHLPLRIWFFIIYHLSLDKGGASASRLARMLGMYQCTVWKVLQKIRHAMGRRDESITLAGFIEMDEAVLGPHARRPTGKRPNKPDSDNSSELPKLEKRGRGRIGKSKKNLKRKPMFLS